MIWQAHTPEEPMTQNDTIFPRSSGVLLHPTSLPGRFGIGDLGEWAYKFADWLAQVGQTVWQVLPLGPTSYGDSPYQSLSAFAGNPLLISLDQLIMDGWLTAADVAGLPEFPLYQVDYGPVITYHNQLLKRAYERFVATAAPEKRQAFERWCQEQAAWLPDFALFVALKDENGGKPWVEWPKAEALREPAALQAAQTRLAAAIGEHAFRQWLFYGQWSALRQYVNGKGIRLVGDIPIFVAHDSADVWVNRQYFTLDESGQPTFIAGVPPDYFSPTGQRWGNPLYRWDKLAADGYQWWIDRIQATLTLVDIVRIDHFRGFAAYWEVPGSEKTAEKGRWVKGPGMDLFKVITKVMGQLPIIAEDLGLITPDVGELRDGLGLPGMRILQFAFGGSGGENRFLPHKHDESSIVYSGTHDNNTTLGWWLSGEATDDIKINLRDYVGHEITEPNWDLIRLGLASVAHTFVAPLQDVWGFGADTRMNTPGRQGGNWGWRFTPEWLAHSAKDRLAYLTKLFGRWPEAPEDPNKSIPEGYPR
ncbi:MAG TPA: 4-alpha-glucanotransferase [Phototrophicaceae bacterium]|nr:4-alpha-glucanotransferase [Phototrophicaceae bacterium]